MIQSQDFLSRLQIPYNDCYSQADIDAKAHAVIDSYHAKLNGTYVTKGLTAGDPAAFEAPDFGQILQRSAAEFALQTAVKAGDIATTHADLDRVNQMGVSIGFAVISCPKSDLEILENAPGFTGRIASLVASGDLLADMVAAKAIIEPALTEIPRPAPTAPMSNITYLPLPLPGFFVGQRWKAPDGSEYRYGSLDFGMPGGALPNLTYYLARVAVILLAVLVGLGTLAQAHAQGLQVPAVVNLACSPQPAQTARSVGEKIMTPYQCWITNDGTAAYTLTPSKFFQSIIAIRPIGPNIAHQIFLDSVNGLPQSKAFRIGRIAVQAAAIGYGAYTGSSIVPLAVSVGMNNAPKILDLLGENLPSAAPFEMGQFTAPVTINPGSDMPPVLVYTTRVRNPQPLMVKLP